MVDYVESPIGRIVNVGWSTGGVGTVSVVTTTANAYAEITDACSYVSRIDSPTTDGSTVALVNLTQLTTDEGYDASRTAADWLLATWTGRTSGNSFRPADFLSTLRCASGNTSYYGNGNSHTFVTAPTGTGWEYVCVIAVGSGTHLILPRFTSGLGATLSALTDFTSGETCDITF